MTRILCAVAMVCALALAVSTAQARPKHHHRHVTDSSGNHADPRPRAWCGWWMRRHLGVSDRAYNLARNWARYGSRAHGPAVGVIVVWRHHVGIIVGRGEDGWIVKSGNDGNAVRERERSMRGVIAYRHPGASVAFNEREAMP